MEDFLKEIVLKAGELAKSYFLKGVQFTTKAHLGDLLTEADTAVNNYLVGAIQRRFPDHRIYSEELAADINPGGAYEWIIDPIDGTRNFAMGIGLWCVMVALYEGGQPRAAAIGNPLASELFFARAGGGATLNGLPIRVNATATLDHAYGFCVRGINTTHEERYRRFLDRIVNDTTVWMHNFGTMLGACYVASGGADFFAENCGFDHDHVAAALICAEAGARVTDSDGRPWQRGRRDIVIANPRLHPELLTLLK
ncbi:MAG: inositol monophosphatase [Candidatus Magasanikbacteria bacterium]|nr:inositol monophosphatase [Candidatus Magasanikbacteria bacterium]